MVGDSQSLAIENALLRGSLYLTASDLKEYQTAKHTADENGMLHLSVPPAVSAKWADALARADKMLRDREAGRGR